MDIITKTGKIWSENAIGAVISLIKESDDSIEAERKLTHWLTEMNCQLIAMALARIDTELYQIYKVQGWRVARRDSRTICCRYGELTYTRRLLQKEGKSFYPLDCKMGFESRKHYSLGMIERIVESVAITTSRSASELLQSLAGITISHQSVISLKNYAGEKAKTYEKALAEEEKVEKPTQPEIIAIEGDGIVLKNKKKGDISEVHRLQVYEGVRKNGNRTELVGLRCFASTSRKELFAMAASYLHGHYDLSKTTVLSNGDGGSGYQFQDFEQMVEGCLDHQHFRDCYHVHEKIRTRLSFCKRKLVGPYDQRASPDRRYDETDSRMDGHCPELRPNRGGSGGGRQTAELSRKKCSLYPKPEPARHPYRNPLGYCRNESPVLQLSHETAGAELVQRRNGVHGLGTDRPEE